ncbi:MAG: hypothetical protein IJ454_04540 [Clostridia bacterium]|nr:hypothetical protein [Clostridia bacterium]
MLNTVCTADFVMLYWDLPESFVAGNQYAVRMDGKIIGRTNKCHYKVNDLSPYSTYKFEVSMEGTTECNVGRVSITTEPVKKRIDITKPPYNAVGDGKTLNTSSIQAAIDDCKPGECVYVPSGDYMTGSLFLHSDMELYLDKNAIIHGTTEVKDYSPKIASRFEGYERMSYAGLINIGTLDRTAGYTCSNVRIMGEGTICGGGWELGQNVIDV